MLLLLLLLLLFFFFYSFLSVVVRSLLSFTVIFQRDEFWYFIIFFCVYYYYHIPLVRWQDFNWRIFPSVLLEACLVPQFLLCQELHGPSTYISHIWRWTYRCCLPYNCMQSMKFCLNFLECKRYLYIQWCYDIFGKYFEQFKFCVVDSLYCTIQNVTP